MTGESASIASSLPVTTALRGVGLGLVNCSMLIAGLPASVHFFERAVMSSTCTVPFCDGDLLAAGVVEA